MKSRSEVIKTRSQAVSEKKPSAAERTVPMFDDTFTHVKCEACEEKVAVKDLERRADGSFECPHCAAPIDPKSKKQSSTSKPKEKPVEREPGDDTDEIEAERLEDEKKAAAEKKAKDNKKPPMAIETRTGNYCGDCGAEWPEDPKGKVKYVINCGHTHAVRVDDPRKAKKMRDVTASGVTTPPSGPVESVGNPNPPTIAVNGRRISMTWGEASFPIAQYSSMKVGNFIMSREVPEGEDPVAVAERMLADLQKIADRSFDVQLAWYRKRLGLLDK